MPSCSCQAPDHDPDHANANHRRTVVQANLIVSAQPPRLEQPAESALYHPSSGQYFETFDVVAAADNLQSQFAEGTQLLHPVDQGSEISAVSPDDLQSSVHAHQRLNQGAGRITVLHGGRSNHQGEDQTQTVHGHMALSARDLLARIVAAFSGL